MRSTWLNGLFCFPVVVPGFQPLLFSGRGSGFSAPFVVGVGVLLFPASLIGRELHTTGCRPSSERYRDPPGLNSHLFRNRSSWFQPAALCPSRRACGSRLRISCFYRSCPPLDRVPLRSRFPEMAAIYSLAYIIRAPNSKTGVYFVAIVNIFSTLRGLKWPLSQLFLFTL